MNGGKYSWLLPLLAVFISCSPRQVTPPQEYVVMVSFDGFRWDYTDHYQTPQFDRMASEGVRVERMIPSFPTKTFPNHYTLATGLTPDHHGIINNNFYAPDLGRIYRMGDREVVADPRSYFGEPIWVTAEKQGVRSASFYWVGSEAPIEGIHPSYWKSYDESVPYLDRIDQVIRWLELPELERPHLVLLYFEEPDGVGHDYGPVHDSTGAMVRRLDAILGHLRGELDRLEFSDQINLIVLSDHGMGATSPDRYVNLNDYLKEGWTQSIFGGNPVYMIDPAEGFADSITLALDTLEGLSAWQKEEIPPHLQFGQSPRFPGILVVADSLWSIGLRPEPGRHSSGAHGYDPRFTAMQTIFYGVGPAFRKNYLSPPIRNVDVYDMVAMLLGINPAPGDGDLSRVMDLFVEERQVRTR
jgi:predicted AlkP superfamily pyrophosphatase or phosphodiesterase